MRVAIVIVAIGMPVLAEAQMHPADKPVFLEPEVVAQLVPRQARIGRIELDIENVFDTSNPEEDKFLYRLANRVHLRTRDGVLGNLLLFESGDLYDPLVLLESERLIRDGGWIADVAIVPSAYDAESNTVDILVTSRDSWSLSTNISFGRSGGENHYGFGFEEKNLFGTGKGVEFLHESNIDRDTNLLGFVDQNVLGSRVRLHAAYASSSDGSSKTLDVGRPFYSLSTGWSIDTHVGNGERVDQVYDLGAVVDAYRHQTRTAGIEGGWSAGPVNNRVRRWLVGFSYDEHAFSPVPGLPPPLLPGDRLLAYPWFGIQLVGDEFRQFVELNDMGRTEDVQIGLNLVTRIGYASTGLGADRDALLLGFNAEKSWQPSDGQLLSAAFAASTRREDTGLANTVLSTNATYYQQMFSKQMFVARLDALITRDADLDQQVLLGGDTGLRGYPVRYQTGTSRALVRVEQRYFTDWYPFRLVRVGWAAFADAGRTWGQDPRGTPSQGMLYDVGLGVRLSSPRSSHGSVIHIDFAMPLNGDPSISGLQVNVSTKASF